MCIGTLSCWRSHDPRLRQSFLTLGSTLHSLIVLRFESGDGLVAFTFTNFLNLSRLHETSCKGTNQFEIFLYSSYLLSFLSTTNKCVQAILKYLCKISNKSYLFTTYFLYFMTYQRHESIHDKIAFNFINCQEE